MRSPGSSVTANFAGFEFNLSLHELRKGRARLRAPDQSLAILAMLLEHPGELVTREAIQARLWPNGTVVEFEHSVNSAIKRLRQALLDTANEPRFIETLPRKGYRFIGVLEAQPDDLAGLTPGSIISHYRILGEPAHGHLTRSDAIRVVLLLCNSQTCRLHGFELPSARKQRLPWR